MIEGVRDGSLVLSVDDLLLYGQSEEQEAEGEAEAEGGDDDETTKEQANELRRIFEACTQLRPHDRPLLPDVIQALTSVLEARPRQGSGH